MTQNTIEFQKQLVEIGFTHANDPQKFTHTYVKEIDIGFLSLNEIYAYEKQTEKTDWENLSISFDDEIIDEKANPKGKEFQKIINQSATKNFSKFGILDLSNIDGGSVWIQPNQRPLINNPDFLNAVNVFIQDTKEIFDELGIHKN